MDEPKILPRVVEQMLYRDFVLALLYLKPGNSLIHEEAFGYALKKAAEEYPQLQEKGFFSRQSSEGSYGSSTYTTLDAIIDGLHSYHLNYSPSYQYSRINVPGRKRVREFSQEYGAQVLTELRPLAQEVWKLARGYPCMHNRQEWYA